MKILSLDDFSPTELESIDKLNEILAEAGIVFIRWLLRKNTFCGDWNSEPNSANGF